MFLDDDDLFGDLEDLIRQGERLPEYEDIISQDFEYSYLYARDVIKGRWPEGEGAILEDPYYSYLYAMDVIDGGWLEAEPIIKKHDIWWGEYCSDLG